MKATGISRREHQRRRRKLLRAMSPGSLAIVPGAGVFAAGGGLASAPRQDSDFWYLTGFAESGAVLALRRGRKEAGNGGDNGGDKDEAILFCQERNAREELYDGERLGPKRAAGALGLDAAHPLSELDARMPALVGAASAVHCSLGEHPGFDQRLSGWLAQARAKHLRPAEAILGLKPLLHELRLVKSAAEIELMRRAAEISVEGHLRAMRACRPGLMEGDLEAELLYGFLRGGARAAAYPSIVAGGANACVLHYMANNAPLRREDLVLIDAGCEHQRYASDLTRTFPVSGRFSSKQRALYEIVLEAQLAAIAACRAGASFDAPDAAALKIMRSGLERLGLSADEPSDGAAADRPAFCPHRASHWLGLDVHDCSGDRPEGVRTLAPGMVLTVEPGLYVPPGMKKAPSRWRGMGVRIEDDVLITADGPEVLTGGAPKSIGDIERAMAGG